VYRNAVNTMRERADNVVDMISAGIRKRLMSEWQEKWNRFVHRIMKTGSEKLTLMVIPHNDSEIINFQLSKFTIFFSIFIFVFLIFSSVLSMGLQQIMRGEVTELTSLSEATLSEREQYLSKYHELYQYNQRVKKILESTNAKLQFTQNSNKVFLEDRVLAEIAQGEIAAESLAIQGILEERAKTNAEVDPEDPYRELDSDFRYGSEVIQYKKLHLDIRQTISSIRSLSGFLHQREQVQQSLPYGWVVKGGHFTSFFGPRISPFGYTRDFHAGVDLADRIGTPIYAAADGYIETASYGGGYGLHVRINHKFGYLTLYGHMSSVTVRSGQYVYKGQMIGRIGNTGRTTGPHLHYEVRYDGRPIDPLPFLTNT